MLGNPICQFNKIGNRQLLSSLGEETMLGTSEVTKDRTKRVANHLTALAKRGLNDLNEERLIAAQMLGCVACKADDSRLDLRGRIEDLLTNGEEILNVVPRLQQNAQDAILARTGRLGDTDGHLALDHTHTLGDDIAVLDNLEENLRRNIIREIADNAYLVAKSLAQVHLQEVALDKAGRKIGIVFVKINNTLGVDFGTVGYDIIALKKELREHTHTTTHLQHLTGGIGCSARQRETYLAGDI